MNIGEQWLVPFVEVGVNNLNSTSIAVDVGANVGDWSRALSEMFDDVIAIEPDERASEHIDTTTNVRLVRAAASSKNGISTLYMRPSAEQNSLLVQHPIGAGGCSLAPVIIEREVATVSLDGVCPRGADFVKIDTEGNEVDILSGCVSQSNWKRTMFVVECHDTYDCVAIELTRLGKSVVRVPHPVSGAHPGHCWAIGEPA